MHDVADWQCLPVPAETVTVTAAQPDLTLSDSELKCGPTAVITQIAGSLPRPPRPLSTVVSNETGGSSAQRAGSSVVAASVSSCWLPECHSFSENNPRYCSRKAPSSAMRMAEGRSCILH